MSDSIKSAILAIITIATVTVFVLPRAGTPVPSTITALSRYLGGSVRAMLGTEPPARRRKPERPTNNRPNVREGEGPR